MRKHDRVDVVTLRNADTFFTNTLRGLILRVSPALVVATASDAASTKRLRPSITRGEIGKVILATKIRRFGSAEAAVKPRVVTLETEWKIALIAPVLSVHVAERLTVTGAT